MICLLFSASVCFVSFRILSLESRIAQADELAGLSGQTNLGAVPKTEALVDGLCCKRRRRSVHFKGSRKEQKIEINGDGVLCLLGFLAKCFVICVFDFVQGT